MNHFCILLKGMKCKAKSNTYLRCVHLKRRKINEIKINSTPITANVHMCNMWHPEFHNVEI